MADTTTLISEFDESQITGIFTGEFWRGQLEGLADTATTIVLNLIFALIVLFIGWLVIKLIIWLLRKLMQRAKVEDVIIGFVLSVLKFFLWMMLIMMILDIINIELVSMAAIIAALAFAIGLAMGDFMNNLIAGVIILSYKHIQVGEFIEGGGVKGTIKEIAMTRTIIATVDNRICIVPNEPLAMGIVENYTRNSKRRVDMTIGVGYDADLNVARKIFTSICKKHPLVLEEPGTVIAVHELADSSVNFVVRPWCKTSDYWTVRWEVTEQAKVALDKAGISIPFPQIDAHIFKMGTDAYNVPAQEVPSEDSELEQNELPTADHVPGENADESYEFDYESEEPINVETEAEYEYEYETEEEPEAAPKKKSSKSSKKSSKK